MGRLYEVVGPNQTAYCLEDLVWDPINKNNKHSSHMIDLEGDLWDPTNMVGESNYPTLEDMGYRDVVDPPIPPTKIEDKDRKVDITFHHITSLPKRPNIDIFFNFSEVYQELEVNPKFREILKEKINTELENITYIPSCYLKRQLEKNKENYEDGKLDINFYQILSECKANELRPTQFHLCFDVEKVWADLSKKPKFKKVLRKEINIALENIYAAMNEESLQPDLRIVN